MYTTRKVIKWKSKIYKFIHRHVYCINPISGQQFLYNGYDPDYAIRTDRLYDVRAIPSLYLLDSEKTVLMKDAPTEKVLPAIFGR